MEVSRTLLLCICVSLSASLPTSPSVEPAVAASLGSFASETSQLIAINMLKSNIDIDGNQIHSPLGITSILAILAEASTGDTYEEFTKVFGYPKERANLRDSYKHILGKYQNSGYSTEPSFQTWLYIYRNFTAREEYKQLLKDYYYVSVKDINREDYDWSEPNTSLDLETSTVSNSKDIIGFETLKLIKEDIALQTTSTQFAEDQDMLLSTKPSKFDQYVDEKQYVEKPVILEEIKKEAEENQKHEDKNNKQDLQKKEIIKEKENISDVSTVESFEKKVATEELKEKIESLVEAQQQVEVKSDSSVVASEKNKREDDLNLQENETVQLDEKLSKSYNDNNEADEVIVPIQEVLASNEPEKVTLPLQKLENAVDLAAKEAGEIMIALESHLTSVRRAFGSRSLFSKDDIASALSANSITGRNSGSKTKMLLFNGLYYRGNWATPFLEFQNNSFKMTLDDTMDIPFMVGRGTYHYAEAAHLNAKILCLPYENKKYAMVLMIPNELEGLHALIEKLQPSDLYYIKTHGEEKDIELKLPKFQVEETSRSEAMLKNLGLNTLFSHVKSDLSLMSEDNDMHVDEIVQFVSLRVDEGGSTGNALSAINTQGRTSQAPSEIQLEVNRPFLYFIMDCEETFVIAAGKVYTPEYKEQLPITIEVELEN